MAISEACQVWIDQRVKEELSEKKDTGKSFRTIGRDIAKEIEKYFEVNVKPDTIRKKATRIGGTNVPPEATTQDASGKPEIKEIKRKNPAKDGTMRGGRREGAGRPKKMSMVSDAMGFSDAAISQLEQIRDDDPQQIQAYLSVIDWLFDTMHERMKRMGMKQEIAWGVVDKSLQSLVGKYINGLEISPKPSPKVISGIAKGINDLQALYEKLEKPA